MYYEVGSIVFMAECTCIDRTVIFIKHTFDKLIKPIRLVMIRFQVSEIYPKRWKPFIDLKLSFFFKYVHS